MTLTEKKEQWKEKMTDQIALMAEFKEFKEQAPCGFGDGSQGGKQITNEKYK